MDNYVRAKFSPGSENREGQGLCNLSTLLQGPCPARFSEPGFCLAAVRPTARDGALATGGIPPAGTLPGPVLRTGAKRSCHGDRHPTAFFGRTAASRPCVGGSLTWLHAAYIGESAFLHVPTI